MVDELIADVAALDTIELTRVHEGERPALLAELTSLQDRLRALSDAIHRQWQRLPVEPRQLRSQWFTGDLDAGSGAPQDLRRSGGVSR